MNKDQARRRHKELVDQGWDWRFTGEEPRVRTLIDTYKSLGIETLVEESFVCDDSSCKTCFEDEEFQSGYQTLYTRGDAKEEGRFDDDLF